MNQVSDHRASFRPQQGEIPTSPGVYRFSDRQGRVLYIGKAKNLRNRLNNYFQPLESLAPRTQRMMQLARHVDWTVVATDTESLILEHTWINEFEPPFNVQFRDDKTYPYLVVTLKDEAPRLIITRNTRLKGARYYGPYPKVWTLRQIAQALQQAFPIRTCNDSDYRRAITSGKPCLSGQIGRCHGPCSGLVTIDEHQKQINQLVSFLNGKDKELLKQLRMNMQTAATEQHYELAAQLRDQISGAVQVLEQNAVVLRGEQDLDVFGIHTDELSAGVHQFMIRNSRIRGERSWIVEVELDDSRDRIIEHALQSAYEDDQPPGIILVPLIPESAPQIIEALQAHRPTGGKIRLMVPERGEKSRLLNRATLNATEQLMRHKLKRATDITSRTDALAQLQEALQIDEPPLRIECVDVSHLHGTEVVASLVVFEDALPAKSDYRKYRIEHTTDDTDSIYQVVKRRALRIAELQDEETAIPVAVARRNKPQLIIVDGGQPQVNAAARALAEVGVTDVALCGIAKRMEEIWLPNDPFPVILPRTSEALFLVQRIRDEAHRVAISYQRSRRSRSIQTQLSEIPGLGPKRIKQLLKHFGSVARLRSASIEEISALPGFGGTLAETIASRLGRNASATLEEATN